MDLIKVTPDKERVASILKMITLIEERIKLQDKNTMTALIIADYYEIVKELLTAILLVDGYKTLSHKELLSYIKQKYKTFSLHEISILNDLRVLRNRVAYEGFSIERAYLSRNEENFKEIIKKLKQEINAKLN